MSIDQLTRQDPERDALAEPTALLVGIRRGVDGDGPGIRSTVVLKGCPFRCVWCPAPETQTFRPEALIHEGLCTVCGECVPLCESHRHVVENGRHSIRPDVICDGCMVCAQKCEGHAIEKIGSVLSLDEVIAILAEDERQHKDDGWGLTIGGGEPLYQSEFTLALLAAAKVRGWHVVLQTSGHAPRAVFEAAIGKADLVRFDVKESDPALHMVWTGLPLDGILENLSLAAGSGADLWVTLPVAPMTNDRDEHWHKVAETLAALPKRPVVFLHPYNADSEEKRRGLVGEAGLLEGVDAPDQERLAEIAGILGEGGLEVRLPGGE